MKKQILQFIAFILCNFCFNEFAFAGQYVGNGGDAHVCYGTNSSEIVSAELFDFFEIPKISEGIYIDLGTENRTWQEKLLFAIARITRLDPVRAERLLTRYNEVFAVPTQGDFKFVQESLPDEPDTGGTGVLPRTGCKIEQAAIRVKEVVAPPYEKRFRINEPIFLKMDDTNKAGLILHELLYEEAIRRGFLNSRRVRFLTAFVASTLIDKYEPDSFRSLLEHDLFMGDNQLLFDRNDETNVIEYHDDQQSFSDASEICESSHAGALMTGYNVDFKFGKFSESPLMRSLENIEWWGELEVATSGQVSFFTLTRDRNRFYRKGSTASSQFGFVCTFLMNTNDHFHPDFCKRNICN